MGYPSRASVFVLISFAATPALAVRAQTPARATTVAYEPTAHVTAQHVQTGSSQFKIETVSTRNDMVSGGNVLIRIIAAPGTPFQDWTVTLNGQPVTSAFRLEPGRRTTLL